jgi:RNA polymerase sigma-70 factor (ECF subfamily)
MKLTTTTNVSVDGVMQGLGGPDEDRRNGFERGGWAIPLLDTEAEDHIKEVYGGAAAFLFGRRTYGELVPLDQQDRGAWDAALVAEGHRLVRERLAAGVAPGRYQILAAINAVHTSARDVRATGWSQVVALYDQLVRLDPSPIVALNRAIAVAELDGPEVALAAVDRLEDKLAGYHAYHATRAELLRRLGCSQESRAAYDKAIELAGNTAETAYLTRRRDQLG